MQGSHNETKPLMKQQHAYQEGKGTESAIHDLITQIEKTYIYKQVSLAAFIDIAGAFDNTPTKVIEEALTNRGLKPWMTNWIIFTLKHRRVKCQSKSCKWKIRPKRGCPQGGCLSPLIWCIVIDELIRILLRESGVHVTAYADDLVLFTKEGINENEMRNKLQRALKLVEEWCKKTGLFVNPEKSSIVRFTKRTRKQINATPIKLFGTVVKEDKTFKYLGVHLDEKLSMSYHITEQAKKGYS